MTAPHDRSAVSPRPIRPALDWARARRALIAILAASWIVRIALAASGGQYFFPDETRFDRSLEFVRMLAAGHLADALRHLVERPDHAGWTVVGLIPATFATVLGAVTGRAPEQFAYVVAMLLSLASVSSIALIFQVARRLGASPGESLAAAVMLSLSASFFYWSRHLMPYDSAMALALAATWVGLRRGGAARSFATGLLAGSGFLVYNGYWTIAVLAVALHCLIGARSVRRVAVRALSAIPGFLLPTLLLLLSTRVVGGQDGIAMMRGFAGTVNQGDWSDGFSLPFAYLWSADRLLFIAWLLAIVVALAWQVWPAGQAAPFRSPLAALYRRRLGTDTHTRAVLLIACVALIYASLAGGSAMARVFVVYGRLARQLVPFLCLLAACVGTAFHRRGQLHGPSVRLVAGLAVFAQLVIAFGPPLTQVFPRELEARLFPYRPLDYALTVVGPTPRSGDSTARFVLVNAQYLYPPRGHRDRPAGAVVVSFPHPLEYEPYRYEGFRAYEREILAGADISLRLVDRGAGAAP